MTIVNPVWVTELHNRDEAVWKRGVMRFSVVSGQPRSFVSDGRVSKDRSYGPVAARRSNPQKS